MKIVKMRLQHLFKIISITKKIFQKNIKINLINSISLIKNHNKLKKYFKTKRKTNKTKFLNKNTLENIIDYNHSTDTEKNPTNKAKTQYNKCIENSRIKIALKKIILIAKKNNNNNKYKRNANTMDKNIFNYNYNNWIQSNQVIEVILIK